MATPSPHSSFVPFGSPPSVLGRAWQQRVVDERAIAALVQAKNIPEVLACSLTGRGIKLEEIEDFLAPTLRALLPDPSHLKDMDRAAERIVRAILAQEKIAIFADYDVDGATSAALMQRYFKTLGLSTRFYIPDRIQEGYGPNPTAMRTLRSEGCTLCLTLDCGVTAFAALEAAADGGLDVVVLDHHASEAALPKAAAIVNPNRMDETSPFRFLAAVGVTFLTLIGVTRLLRQKNFFTADRPEPDLKQWLDLVAIGTICDVVPLTHVNRAFVVQGLKVLAQRQNIGLAALADQVRLSEVPTPYHAGFVLGPRINAGGRIGTCDVGARLLSTDDPVEAMMLAQELDASNTHRKTIEAQVLKEALAQAESVAATQAPLTLVSAAGWHPGVIGIVAARLKEKYHRPAFVIAVGNDNVGKASARSVHGLHLGSMVTAARHQGLLISGGGHAMAAGFSVEAGRIEDLRRFLADKISEIQPTGPATPTLEIEGLITPGGATLDLTRHIARLGPFGAGNPEPHFALINARVVRADVVGEQHISCIISGTDGARLKAVAFRALETPLGEALLKRNGLPLTLAGHLRINSFRGEESVQFQIEDAIVG